MCSLFAHECHLGSSDRTIKTFLTCVLFLICRSVWKSYTHWAAIHLSGNFSCLVFPLSFTKRFSQVFPVLTKPNDVLLMAGFGGFVSFENQLAILCLSPGIWSFHSASRPTFSPTRWLLQPSKKPSGKRNTLGF